VHNDTKVKAGILNEQFASVFTSEPDDSPATHLEGGPFPNISPVVFTVTGITKLLQNLQTHKATGPDGIPTHLKITAEESVQKSYSNQKSHLLHSGSHETGLVTR